MKEEEADDIDDADEARAGPTMKRATEPSEAGATSGGGPVITIDGPAGSGKSTTAREVARRLGYRHLDSGALYRAITYSILESGLPAAQWNTLTEDRLEEVPIRLKPAPEGFAIFLDGERIDAELRTPQVTENVSRLAPLPAVRARLLSLQRQAAALGGLVADGRDMGSVVFPDADLKVFLVADLQERARRRLLERHEAPVPAPEGRRPTPADAKVVKGGAPEPPSAEAVREESIRLHERDTRDSIRALAPLRQPDDAVLLDTTGLDFEEQVRAVIALARERFRT